MSNRDPMPDLADPLPLRPGETWASRIAEVVREERFNREDAEAMLAEQQSDAEAAAEADLAREFEEIAERMREGEPPDDLDVDTAGLPPMRARLARYQAWVSGKRAELEQAKQARPHLVAAQGKPAETEARRAAMKAEDEKALLEWALNKVADPDFAEPRPVARSFEAEQIRKQFAQDEHAAAVALEALAKLDATVARLERELPALEVRSNEFLHDALLEHADEMLARKYVAQIDELQRTATALFGLNVIVRGRGGFRGAYADDEVEIGLPIFDLPAFPWHRGETVRLDAPRRPELKVTAQQAQRAAEPWRDLARLWRADPRAEPPSPLNSSPEGSVP